MDGIPNIFIRGVEWLLGLDKGILSRHGEWTWKFSPDWPFQKALEPVGGAGLYNFLAVLIGVALVIYVYRREGKSLAVRISLAVLRLALIALVLILLNRPVLTLGEEQKQPSVVAILVDDTISMSVPDMPGLAGGRPIQRIQAVQNLLDGHDAELLRELAQVHDLRIYRFGRDAQAVASIVGQQNAPHPAAQLIAATQPASDPVQVAAGQIQTIRPIEDGTQVVQSLRTVEEELQGSRLAAIVVLTDGHDTPVRERAEAVNEIHQNFSNVPVYAVAVGQDRMPRNIEIQKPDFEPAQFVDDMGIIKVHVRATGFEPNHRVHVSLWRKDGRPAVDEQGRPIAQDVIVPDDQPVQTELIFTPAVVLGLDPHHMPRALPAEDKTLDLVVKADKEPDVLNEADSVKNISIDVLDTQIRVLLVDGYPRWEYRYIKTSLLRDKTMVLRCLLTSADPSFIQEATEGKDSDGHIITPLKNFPTTLEELMDEADVVLFGDVDEHQFTDAQLQLISDFVSKRGGGFGMIAGPRYSPQSYKNTPIQPILPVDISHSESDESRTPITQGFLPVVTSEGWDSSIFRFYPSMEENKAFLKSDAPPLFWYCHNVIARPQATVMAEHPTDLVAGTQHKAPILVVSQFGAGRTLFSAIDGSWRWRFYKYEQVFNTYWVQQIRYLARNRKLDQRKIRFETDQKDYQLGQQVTLDLNVLSPQLSRELSAQIPVEIVDNRGQPVKRVLLNRQENSTKYTASWTADSVGQYFARLPALGDVKSEDSPFDVKVPQTELESPQVDRSLLSNLGRPVEFDKAAVELPQLIHSAAKTLLNETAQPLWSAPLVLILFALLITAEWVLRKMNGML